MSDALPLIVVAVAATAAAAIDVRTRRIPNALNLGVALVGLGIAAMGWGRVGVAMSLAGCAVGLGLMLPGYVLGATGGGDVKLLAALGTLLGPMATIRGFIAMAIAGGVIALVVALRRGRLTATLVGTALVASGASRIDEIGDPHHENRFAYGPAIAIGAIVAALT